ALAAVDKTHLGTPALANGVSVPIGIGVEALLTIFLVWAVYGTAVSPLAPRIAGFGIGLTVATDILMGGPLTGAAMNPARHVATAIPAAFFDNWYVYWVGPLLGAAVGGLSIRLLFAQLRELATPAMTWPSFGFSVGPALASAHAASAITSEHAPPRRIQRPATTIVRAVTGRM